MTPAGGFGTIKLTLDVRASIITSIITVRAAFGEIRAVLHSAFPEEKWMYGKVTLLRQTEEQTIWVFPFRRVHNEQLVLLKQI